MSKPKKIDEIIYEYLAEIKAEEIPLTRKQAAVFCNVSPNTINNWESRGLLKRASYRGLDGYLKSDLLRLRK